MEATDERLLYLSVLTLGDIRKGIVALTQGRRRTKLETWLDVDLQARFAGRVLPIGSEVADRWGTLAAEAKRKGTNLPVIDGLLAATALHYNLTLVTRNAAHFIETHASVLNPWQL